MLNWETLKHGMLLRRSIERDSEDLIRIGFDGRLFLIGRTTVRATAAAASSDSPPPPANERILDLTEEDVAIDAADVDCAAGRLAAAVCREDDGGGGEADNRSEGKLYRVNYLVS